MLTCAQCNRHPAGTIETWSHYTCVTAVTIEPVPTPPPLPDDPPAVAVPAPRPTPLLPPDPVAAPAGVAVPPAAPPAAPHPRKKRQPAAPHDLVLAWSLWLIVGGLLTVLTNPGHFWFRVLVMIAFLGLMLAWPLFRLSQDFDIDPNPVGPRHLKPPGLLFVDWLMLVSVLALALAALYQRSTLIVQVENSSAVFTTNTWTARQVLSLNAVMAAWSLLAGGVAALGCRTNRPGPRSLAMLACVLLLLGPHLPQVLGVSVDVSRVSALRMVWTLTAHSSEIDLPIALAHAAAVGVSATLVWIVALRTWAHDE